MGVTCDILIQNPRGEKHLTGESIKGIVKLYLDNDKVYKKISLSLIEKRLSWYDYWRNNKEKEEYRTKRIWAGDHVRYKGFEANTVTKIYLLDKQTGENITFKAGTHEHPFEISIPENIPPSVKIIHYKEPVAGIEYYLVLKLKKSASSFSFDTHFKTKVDIYNKIDSSITDEPVPVTLNKNLIKLFSSKKQEIKLQAVLYKEYSIPSSEINISFVVNNTSDVIFNVQTELICDTSIKPDFKDRTGNTEVVAKVETPTIPDNSVSNMSNTIPVGSELCTVRHSNMINREYKVRITLKLPPPHINSFVDIPVVIGEKLIADVNEVRNDEAGQSSKPMEKPPSYREAVVFEDCSNNNRINFLI